jgi:hypothetical protein
MVLGRASVTILLGSLLTLASCRGQSTNPKPSDAGSAGDATAGSAGTGMEGGAPNETAGTAGVGGAGTQATGGSAGTQATGGSAGAESGGMSGLGGGAGHGNTAGLGGSAGGTIPDLPGASDREREILAPLATDDATLDATSGGDLIELALAVGAARGYTMCRCVQSPTMPPADIEQMLRSCAAEESGIRELSRPDEARCIEEGMATLPAAEEYLRCRIKQIRDDVPNWVNRCSDPDAPWIPPESCTASPETTMLLQQCQFVVYCGDGTRVSGSRCDRDLNCSDQSDELGCFETTGYDWFWCDPDLVGPWEVCGDGACGLEKTPPVCDPDRPNVYLCNDGGEVSVESICNRESDCPDGSDERYCFK